MAPIPRQHSFPPLRVRTKVRPWPGPHRNIDLLHYIIGLGHQQRFSASRFTISRFAEIDKRILSHGFTHVAHQPPTQFRFSVQTENRSPPMGSTRRCGACRGVRNGCHIRCHVAGLTLLYRGSTRSMSRHVDIPRQQLPRRHSQGRTFARATG